MLFNQSEWLSDDERMLLDRSLGKEGDVVVLDVLSNDYSSSETNRTIVADIRESFVSTNGLTIFVGGETAEGMDTSQSLNERLTSVLLFTLAFIFIVLMFTFKSILLPLKAIIMNLLSLAATYGVLVAIFQWGWGSTIFGFGEFGFIQSFIPILLLGLLFSLSTDYEVFLLSRVKEEYMRGASNEESVALA
ncbi:MMPL family transporter [Bacillus sp. JCM 19041]|uniref:MMPL family transporter n=1 Tax=Bacillus sp. JCM 19041 TaxID=1460637 RepID=UPI0006D25974